jgi:drug/metabolite transporter (DMT)-like permease
MPLLAIIAAAAFIAEAAVLFKTFPKAHPITTNALAMAVGALILFGVSIIGRETPHWPVLPVTWIALTYLVLLGSVGTFVLVLYVLSEWTATATSYQLVLMPIVTVLFASWLAQEKITLPLVLGGLLVLAGVYVGALMPPDLLKRAPLSRAASDLPETAPGDPSG